MFTVVETKTTLRKGAPRHLTQKTGGGENNMSITKLALRQDTGAAELATGWLITPEFSSREGFRIDAGGKKVPDDKALAARVQTVLNQSHRILRTWCAPAF